MNIPLSLDAKDKACSHLLHNLLQACTSLPNQVVKIPVACCRFSMESQSISLTFVHTGTDVALLENCEFHFPVPTKLSHKAAWLETGNIPLPIDLEQQEGLFSNMPAAASCHFQEKHACEIRQLKESSNSQRYLYNFLFNQK